MAVFDPLNPLANITPMLTMEQMEQITSWFDENAKPLLKINDEEPSDVVTIDQLEEFLETIFKEQKNFHRRDFQYPSYAKLMREVESLKMDHYGVLLKDQLIYMINKWIIEPDIKHELKLAFAVFDTEDRNFIEVDLIKDKLTTLGEPFSAEEVIEFIRDANMWGDGNIRYAEFVESMFKLAPNLSKLPKEFLYKDPEEDPSVPPLLPPEPPAESELKQQKLPKPKEAKDAQGKNKK